MGSIENSILEHEQRLYQAQLTSDVAALDELLADDLLFCGLDGRSFSKEDDLAMHRSGTLKILSLEPKGTEVREIAPAVVAVAVVAAVKAVVQGVANEGTLRYLRIWVRKEGRWRIAAGSMQMLADDRS